MNIRSLAPSDAAEVAALWHSGALESALSNTAFSPRISIEDYAVQVEAELSAGQIIGWGVFAEGQNRLVAYLTAKVIGRSAEWEQEAHLYVLDVDVQASQRRKGYARALLAQAVAHAKSLGIARLELSWLADDPRSSAVWATLGIRPYLHRGYLELSEDQRLTPPSSGQPSAAAHVER